MRYLSLTLALVIGACTPPRPPMPQPPDLSIWAADCVAMYRQELGRDPEPEGLLNCERVVQAAFERGEHPAQHAFLRVIYDSPEWKARQEALREVVLPRLVPSGSFFMQADGARFTVIDATDFSLYSKFMEGIDIEPILTQREQVGFNMVRIFGACQNTWPGYTANVSPTRYGDAYYQGLVPFHKKLAKHHLYSNWVAFCGNTDIPSVGGQQQHWDRLNAYMVGITNTIVSAMNEHNVHPLAGLMLLPKPVGVVSSHGSNGGTPDGNNGAEPPTPHWDWTELHTNDTYQWVRKVGHNCWELNKSKPCIASENTRAPDRFQSEQEAFDAAAGAALLAAGSTFHSFTGRASGLWDGLELALARAWVRGAKSVPLSCQLRQYRHERSHIDTEVREGLLRVYQRGFDPACVVKIHYSAR